MNRYDLKFIPIFLIYIYQIYSFFIFKYIISFINNIYSKLIWRITLMLSVAKDALKQKRDAELIQRLNKIK